MSGLNMDSKLILSWNSTSEIRPEVETTMNLTFWIATLSGPKNWIPASSDILTNDTNRSDPLMIKHSRKEWKENRATFAPIYAWYSDIVKLEFDIKINYN